MARWGIVGTGGVAQRFATAAQSSPGTDLVAVCSRTSPAADAFADRFGIQRRHIDVSALARDPAVEVVYIATPNHRHHVEAIELLEAGKHVLCEKPFALDAGLAAQVIAVARRNDRFLMEAIWSRFLPAYTALAQVLERGVIGRVRQLEASFGFAMPVMSDHRLFDLAQGGGSLLDIGIYPLQLSSFVLGPPDRIEAVADIGSTGVDEVLAMVLHHPSGAISSLRSAIRASLPNDARIVGESGTIEIPAFMHCPDRIVVHCADGIEEIDAAFDGDGLRFEIEEVERCLADGRRESSTMTLDDTLLLASTMDDIRRRIGVVYPIGADR